MNQEMFQRIVDQSLALFLEKGYNNVKVSDICEKCHITKPTFYRFASSKGDLVLSYYEQILDYIVEVWEKSEYYHGYFSPIVCIFGFWLAQLYASGTDLVTNFLMHSLSSKKDAFYNSSRFFEKMENVIKIAQEQGDITNLYPPEVLTQILINVMVGYIFEWSLSDGKTDLVSDFLLAVESICVPDKWVEDD